VRNYFILFVSVLSFAFVSDSFCQEDEDLRIGGKPLENSITGNGIALRVRGEFQMTDDDADLIDSDINYIRFPSRMFDGDVKMFQSDGFSTALDYSYWSNEQDLNTTRYGFMAKAPFGTNATFFAKYRIQDGGEILPNYTFYYLGFSKNYDNGFYSSTQYRYKYYEQSMLSSSPGSQSIGHQISEYVSYAKPKSYRIGAQVAISNEELYGGLVPWFGRLAGTKYLFSGGSSVRLEGQYYQATEDLSLTDLKASYYHKLGRKIYTRIGYRYYKDNSGLEADSYSAMLKYFFSTKLQVHSGYRLYQHSTGDNMNTVYMGFSLLM